MRVQWVGAIFSLFLFSSESLAQSSEPAPFPEFTFRSVTPPARGDTALRINIQIVPQADISPSSVPPQLDAPPVAQDVAWFWSEVPDAITGGAIRFQLALAHLADAPEAASLGVARADDLGQMAAEYGASILAATIGTRVSPALVLAVMAVESAGQPDAESIAGAQGLMQLIPATAERFGVDDSFDPSQNIAGGVAYLDWLMEEFDRDPVLVLAAYNAGEGAIRSADGVPEFAETRRYVPKVLATWQLARLLCLTPPELIWDGCVFRTMTGG